MCLFDLAFGGLHRAGECALLVPEQLAFEQGFGNRRAVDRDERALVSGARIVDRPRQQLFPRSARAEQHDGDIGARDALDRPCDLEHFRRRGHDPAEHPAARHRVEPRVLGFEFVDVECARDDQPQLVDVERLLIEIIGPARDRAHGGLARTVPRCDDDLGAGLQTQNLFERRKALARAVGIGRKPQVERHHIGRVQPQHVDRGRPIARDDDLIILIRPAQLPLQPLIVLDDQELRFFDEAHAARASAQPVAAGSQIVKLLPSPGALRTAIRPPIAATSARAS